MKKLTRKDHARISVLIHELARMSHDGWRTSTAADWQPLEQELAALLARKRPTTKV